MKNRGRTVLLIIMALLLFSPLDFVPDAIPVVGWSDDLIYIITILYQIFQMSRHKDDEVIIDE